MGYMARLGLWGDGTCFPQFHDFLGLSFIKYKYQYPYNRFFICLQDIVVMS